MSNIIQELEAEQMNKDIPDFGPGDTVVVRVRVKEGNRERLQAFEGVVIAKRNRGLNSAFTVRKISHGEGVERAFQTTAPSSTASRSSAVATCAAPSCTTCVVVRARRPVSAKSSTDRPVRFFPRSRRALSRVRRLLRVWNQGRIIVVWQDREKTHDHQLLLARL